MSQSERGYGYEWIRDNTTLVPEWAKEEEGEIWWVKAPFIGDCDDFPYGGVRYIYSSSSIKKGLKAGLAKRLENICTFDYDCARRITYFAFFHTI